MKVNIGPYKKWWGPYQIAGLLEHIGVSKDACDRLGEKLSGTRLNGICQWIERHRTRKIKVCIDDYDVWSMDHTLSVIILPMLQQLQQVKHGAPSVDDSDVPDELKSTAAPPKENEYDTDANWFARWDYVLGEMIFAFESKQSDWQEQFYSGDTDYKWELINPDEPDKEKHIFEMKEGPNHTFKVDHEGMKKYQDRISNGFRLFGRYYEGLWD